MLVAPPTWKDGAAPQCLARDDEMRILVICSLLLAAFGVAVADAQAQTGLAAIAKKEKSRRKDNRDKGKVSGQAISNVPTADDPAQSDNVPKFKNLERYERELDATVNEFREVCRVLAGQWQMCSGATEEQVAAACAPDSEEWKQFVTSEFEALVRARWNKTCTDAYSSARARFEHVIGYYDGLYIGYEQLASEKGRSKDLTLRQIPPAPAAAPAN